MRNSLPDNIDPVHIRDVSMDLMLAAARSGALPREELEEAASRGNRLAVAVLVALELEARA